MTHKSPMDLSNKLLLVSAALGLMFQIVGIAQMSASNVTPENGLYGIGVVLWVVFFVGAAWMSLDKFANWGMVLAGIFFVFGAHNLWNAWAFWVFLAVIPFIVVLARLAYLTIEHREPKDTHPQMYLLTALSLLLFLFGAARFLPTISTFF